MNKNITRIVITMMVTILFCTSVQAEDTLFYAEYTEEMKNSVVNRTDRERYVKSYIEGWILEEGEKYDESKVEYFPEELYVEYENITKDQYLDFLKAEDKRAMLDTFDIKYWTYPVAYDGERLKNYVYSFYYVAEEDSIDGHESRYWSYYNNSPFRNEYLVTIQNKAVLKEYWESQGIVGYEPVCVLAVDFVYLPIAVKDGEYFTVFINYNELTTEPFRNKYLEAVADTQSQLIAKRIWTADEVNTFLTAYAETKTEMINSMTEEEKALNGGQEEVYEPREISEQTMPEHWIIIAVGGTSFLIFGIIFFLFFKKKSRKARM